MMVRLTLTVFGLQWLLSPEAEQTMEKTISIIGAGAGGILVLDRMIESLADVPGSRPRILLIEKGREFGSGLAYSTPLDAHIINMRASTMGGAVEDATHFSRWLASHSASLFSADGRPPYEDAEYPPRRIYGEYLKDMFSKALEKAATIGVEIQCLHDEAVGLHQVLGVHRIALASGASINTDATILALGNFPHPVLPDMRTIKGFLNYPWPVEAVMDSISGTDPVCVLGAGLSAIDTLHTLLAAGQKEKVYFVSRNGLLPKVRGLEKSHELQFLSVEKVKSLISRTGRLHIGLDELVDLFIKEIEAAEGIPIDWERVLNPEGTTLEILERDIERAEDRVIPYQSALTATEDIIGRLWNLLSTDDQCRFDREYKSLWTVNRYSMPLINAKKVRDVLRSGQLEVLSGLTSISHVPSAGSFVVEARSRRGDCQTLKVPVVINATGQCLDASQIDGELVQQMLTDGIAASHPSGGINVDYDSCRVIDGTGQTSDSLFALGELTRGVHFYTNGIGPCAQRARDIVRFIVDQQML